MAAHAPRQSSLHWEIEHWWGFLRRALAGQHLGFEYISKHHDRSVPVAADSEATSEEVLEGVAKDGRREYMSIVRDAADRLGKPMTIEYVSQKERLLADLPLL